jgi:hypothetical protein
VRRLWSDNRNVCERSHDGSQISVEKEDLNLLVDLSVAVLRRKFQRRRTHSTIKRCVQIARAVLDFAEWRHENAILRLVKRSVRLGSCVSNPIPSARRLSSLGTRVPDISIGRLARHAIALVVAAFRPLSHPELLAALVIEFTEGNNTSATGKNTSATISQTAADQLRLILETYLYLDSADFVHLRSEKQAEIASSGCDLSYREANGMMTVACLLQIGQHPLLMFRPWECVQDLQSPTSEPFLRYVMVFWKRHYAIAEKSCFGIQERLHRQLQVAWVEERVVNEFGVNSGQGEGEALDTWVFVEALDVGLEFSRAYGFQRLEQTYRKLGASASRSLNRYEPSAFDLNEISSERLPDQSHSSTSSVTCRSSWNWQINNDLKHGFDQLSMIKSGNNTHPLRDEKSTHLDGEPWQLVGLEGSITCESMPC